MIYKVTLKQEGVGVSHLVIETLHVPAETVSEAETKVLAYVARKQWGSDLRVASVEETDIVMVTD